MASFMRNRPEHGSTEVGFIVFAKALRRTAAATDAMALMAAYVFETLGYRRYEWKCDAENAASRTAAERLGFRFEGVFRNDMWVRGRNRDTAWYSITDAEWPVRARALSAWLSPDNFDMGGRQCRSLADVRRALASNDAALYAGWPG